MNIANHVHAFYVLLAIIFACVITYMFLYGKRSKEQQKKIERQHPLASKEEGILEAQDAMRQERREHHRH